MQWYVVKKHVNGHYYWYWQKTYREGRHVRTLNKYIGPVGKVSRPIGPRPIAPVVVTIKKPASVITHPDLTGATTIPMQFPVRINKNVVEFALKAVTADVSTTDMDQAWRVKSVNAEIENKRFSKVEEALQRLGVVVQHDDLSGNYFSPSDNFINVIPKKCWYATKGNTDIYRYYRTVCHELVHWTGHESRLNRIDFRSWGDKRYSLEELTAEMGSVMLLKILGYQEGESTEYHAAYFSSWMDRFTGNERKEAIEQAKQRATKAVEYILEHGGIL